MILGGVPPSSESKRFLLSHKYLPRLTFVVATQNYSYSASSVLHRRSGFQSGLASDASESVK